MKTTKINLARLRNDEHFQFQSEFKTLVIAHNAKSLGIDIAFENYLDIYNQEEEALHVIRKSTTTDQLIDADNDRDIIFRGFHDTVTSAINHYSPEKRTVAKRLTTLLNQHGNVAHKAYNEETASLTKMVQELQTTYAADVAALDLTEWVAELNSRNITFDELMKSRYNEGASKTDLIVREVRTRIDAAFRKITERIDALIVVNGAAAYETFVDELNIRIQTYSNNLAQRHGRASAHNQKANAETSIPAN